MVYIVYLYERPARIYYIIIHSSHVLLQYGIAPGESSSRVVCTKYNYNYYYRYYIILHISVGADKRRAGMPAGRFGSPDDER